MSHIFFAAYDNQFDNEISAGYSEDSDYTSDLNYPVGQHANSSASQFRSVAYQISTPQRSLETSRENSYERDDAPNAQPNYLMQPTVIQQQHLSPETHRIHHMVSILVITIHHWFDYMELVYIYTYYKYIIRG